ncbi:uncharacterized protein K452DRAFT_289612 [Aplosporella prunicola CBS 121167]|uniref:Adhesin domain-containing protein n=1 Tax=Aplosporella prunicola CBS 121167 TaxID=1176127 RepID=A0A6A6B8C8_9PEZI|nr:uncharacterized protein K452DRAFT_289612 [Aplosporella prunicola CBS 121167]KAF2139613.1 hypothetical protein K452DRAFT_289612 [Aplosporella prunicola CBS 121167]
MTPKNQHDDKHSPSTPSVSTDKAQHETTPLLGAEHPPPPYWDSTAGPYQAGAPLGLPSIVYVYDGPGAHEGMDDLHPDRNAGIVHRQSSRHCSRGRLLLALAGHAIVVWLIFMAIKGNGAQRNPGSPSHEPPSMDVPNIPGYCRANPVFHTENAVFDFEDPETFRLYESVDTNGPSHTVVGEINLVPAPPDQKAKINVNLTFSTSERYENEHIYAEKSDTEVKIKSYHSSNYPRPVYYRPCTWINGFVYIKPGTTLDTLGIVAKHLSLRIHSDLATTASNETSIDLRAGNLHSCSSASLSSRRTHIDLTSGSVSGSYPLFDLLAITTHSGSITISVDPKSADEEKPEPAEFSARSNVGSVDVTFPIANLPAREYRTAVHTDAGSIKGAYVHGTSTVLTTNSGSITAGILPYAADDHASELRTNCHTGTARIELLAPYKKSGKQINRLKSEHSGMTGSLHVKYPQEWEGSIKAESVTSSVSVKGKDVRVVGEGSKGPIGKWIEAVKGDGKSTVLVKSVSGSVEALIGDL